MMPPMGTNDRNSIQTTDKAVVAMQKVSDATKLPKKVIAERVLVWLAEQDEITRSVVLKMTPDALVHDAARIFMQKILSQNAKKTA